jgi:hypothetical protein
LAIQTKEETLETAKTTGLAQDLQEKTDRFVRMIGPALDVLAKITAQYEQGVDQQKSRTAELQKIRQSLETETFRLIVMGRFKNGKSTLLNAMLGKLTQPMPELPQGGAPLPTSDMPCTPTLTSIHYSDHPTVRVQYKNEQWREMTFQRYLSEARVRPDGEENKKAFDDVLQFELGFPVELCKAGITLLDSPGRDDDPDRNMMVDEAIGSCDAAIVVYRSDVFGGMSELQDVTDMEGNGLTRYFSIVNLRDKRPVDGMLKGFVWDKLVTRLKGGPAYAQQDFTSQDIYFVDALTALEGKLQGDAQKVKNSGLAFFEENLRDFLEKDRRVVHIQRFVQGADSHAQAIKTLIEKRIPLLQKEQADFERRYAEIQPELERIHAQKRRLKTTFDRYRRDCQQKLEESFEQLFTQIRQELQQELKSKQLPSLHSNSFWKNTLANALSPFQKKKLTKEATDIAAEIVQKKVDAWQKAPATSPGASQVLARVIEKMQDDVSREVTAIGREYDQIHFHLSGWTPNQAEINLKGPGWGERIVAGGIGLALGQPDYILTGGVGGMKGLGRDLAGRLAIAVPLILLHAPLLPVVIPAAMIGGLVTNIVWGASSLEKEIKDKVVQQLVWGDPKTGDEGLRGEVTRAKPHLQKIVTEIFGKIETDITQKVEQRMNEEERTIQNSLKDSSRSAEEKKQLIAAMQSHLGVIAKSRQVLADALNAAKQG